MQARAFTIFTKTDLAAIRLSLESIVSTWGEKWFISSASLPTVNAVANAFESKTTAAEASVSMERRNNNAACRLTCPARALQNIYSRATGDQATRVSPQLQPASLEYGFLTGILDDLLALALHDQSNAEAASPVPYTDRLHYPSLADFREHKGSGTVVATIQDQGAILQLHLSQDAARALCGKRPVAVPPARLTSRRTVIGSGKLKVQVSAGDAEIRLADLMDLKPGDVVRLNLKPDQPFTVQTADTREKICSAYMGTLGANKAVELINQ